MKLHRETNKKIAITINNLHISYKTFKRTSIKSNILKINNKIETYHALKGINLEIEKGKILGVIGPNGAGKSTLLRAIAGIFSPDIGEINLHNNSVSLLSIGVGFNKKLTGRENIYLSGMLLGFSEEEIRSKEKSIIEFADIGEFIDKPIKTYSSGMNSKLAFSITAILETDIILIDEILSVGDAKFKEKSYKKIKELIKKETRTVVIVSHNLDTIVKLCDELVLLVDGVVISKGEPNKIVSMYIKYLKEEI